MILHTISKSPFSSSCFDDCLQICTEGAGILLLEDGVYAAQANTDTAALIEENTDLNFYVLSADVNARGLADKLTENITLASDADFVELTIKHHSVQSWY